MLWFLRNVDFAPGLERLVARFRAAVGAVGKDAKSLFAPEALALRDARLAELTGARVPAALGAVLVDIPATASALDAVLVSEATKASVTDTVTTLFALQDAFDLGALRQKAAEIHATDPYERLALDRAASATDDALRRIAIDVIGKHGAGAKGVEGWAKTKGAPLAATRSALAGLTSGTLNQAKLTVLAGLLGDLARG